MGKISKNIWDSLYKNEEEEEQQEEVEKEEAASFNLICQSSFEMFLVNFRVQMG